MYSVAYRRTHNPKGLVFYQQVVATDFFEAVKMIRDVSSDEGPVIYHVIEMPESMKPT